jgi:cytochrome c-type biogenesis protein CcmE
LAIGSSIVLSAMAYVAYLGASSSWQYYLTVDECLTDASTLFHQRVRVTGEIAADSLCVAQDRAGATFVLAGTRGNLTVNCSGQLPDNLAEGKQVVVEGRLQDTHRLVGDKVLTRCASKYTSQMSPAESDPVRPGIAE